MKFIFDPINLFILTVVVISGGALLWPLIMGRGRKASPFEVTQMINRGKTVLVDVRETAEFAAGHLREARHIALGELDKRIGELDKSKDKTVVVVCQNGARSAQAVAKLQKAGFADVLSLDGGLAAWQAAGLPVAK
ncbi:MAG: rhodanese-like domain-containing protein [Pseudomonadota bacterium]